MACSFRCSKNPASPPSRRNPLFAELAARTGETPKWNFHKYLIDRNGNPAATFASKVEPDNSELVGVLEKLLAAKAAPQQGLTVNAPEYLPLPDTQSLPDARELPIERVGVKGLRYPVALRTAEGGVQNTIAEFGDVCRPRARRQGHAHVALRRDARGAARAARPRRISRHASADARPARCDYRPQRDAVSLLHSQVRARIRGGEPARLRREPGRGNGPATEGLGSGWSCWRR